MKELYKKIAAVQKDGLSIGKSGTNTFHKYKYATEQDVLDAIDTAFVKHNLICSISVEDVSIVDNGGKPLTRVKLKFTLVDVDSGESLDSVFYGDGEDKGDKGVYKAYTGAQKYFFMKTFRIATGDDPEKDEHVSKLETLKKTVEATPAPAEVKKASSFKKPEEPKGDEAWI